MVEADPWKQLSQCLPANVYSRLMVQLDRIGMLNKIGTFHSDSRYVQKSRHEVGPRVQCLEVLTILLERSSDESLTEQPPEPSVKRAERHLGATISTESGNDG
jgi:hypothetical protein